MNKKFVIFNSSESFTLSLPYCVVVARFHLTFLVGKFTENFKYLDAVKKQLKLTKASTQHWLQSLTAEAMAVAAERQQRHQRFF